MKRLIIAFFVITGITANAQTVLTIEGQTYANTNTNWIGIEIPRSEPTKFSFLNNSITSRNVFGYMLQAGDEAPISYNNNLDGAVITGNKFLWTGTNLPNIITHGLFAGYNRNVLIRYNYLERVPYGIIFKSGSDQGSNMTFDSGGCAYNIVKDGKFSVRIKGMNGVKIYNNTFYSGDEQIWYFILITSNGDRTVPAPSVGTKVFNNIFYSTRSIPMIKIETSSLNDFECDYNVYWSTDGNPKFSVDDTELTWEQWRARGYDAHSVIYNPDFLDNVSFQPARMDFGMDLGSEWNSGISPDAQWVAGQSPSTEMQSGTWQAGAVIYPGPLQTLELLGGVISLDRANIIELVYSQDLANIIPTGTSFTVLVNSISRTIRSVSVSGTRVILTLVSIISPEDVVSVSYTRPESNKVRSISGSVASSFTTLDIEPGGSGNFTDSSDVKIYPNPAGSFINILIQHPSLKEQRLRIYDFSGKLHFEMKLESGRDFFTIPLSLGPGMYFAQMLLGEMTVTEKLVIFK